MEYLIAWNAINTIGLIWFSIKLMQEKSDQSKINAELEKLIKKASPRMRR